MNEGWVNDQVDAAADNAADLFRRAVTALPNHVECAAGGIVERVVRDFMAALRGPLGRCCKHVTPSPMVVFGSAALMGAIGCGPCINAHVDARLAEDQSDGLGRTCDACHKKALMGKAGLVQNGPLLLSISLCPLCAALDECTPRTDDETEG